MCVCVEVFCLHIHVPANARHVEVQSRCPARATSRGHCLGLAEDLRNVDVVQTLAPTSTSRKLLRALPVHRDWRPPETVRQTLLQQSGLAQGRSTCLQLRSRSKRSSKHSTRMSALDRFTSALIGALLGNSTGSSNFDFFGPRCSSLSSSRTCKQWELLVAVLMTKMIHPAQQK